MSKLRMLIGTLDIGGNIRMLADGFRACGFDVSTAWVTNNGVFYDRSFDLYAGDVYQAAADSLRAGVSPEVICDDPRYRHFFDFDVYLFLASHSLFPGLFDLPLLKMRGKIVISFQCGSEVRFSAMARSFNEAYGHGFPESLLHTRANTADDFASIACQSRYLDLFSNKLHNIRMAERFSDVVLSQPCSNVLAVRPYMAAILPVDRSRCRPNVPQRDRPVIVHAPTNVEFKRSDLIVQTLLDLWSEGHGFELRLIRNLPNERVLEALTDCDILIDQVACGKTGLLGYEGMASGCVVLGCNDEEAAPIPHRSLPVVRIAPDNLYGVLKRVLMDAPLRVQCAEAGLRYMSLGHHEPANVAAYILDCLEREKAGDFDYYPAQLIERPEVPSGEHVPGYLCDMTAEVLSIHGVPPDVNLDPLRETGQLDPDFDLRGMRIPTWDLSGAERTFWGWRGCNATWPHRRPRADDVEPEAGE